MITGGLSALSIFLFGGIFVWLIAVSVLFKKIITHYSRLTKGISSKDLKSVLDSLLKNSEEQSRQYNNLSKVLTDLKKDNYYNIQKIGLIRFNPFAETGGDQSFCLAVLDGNDSGFVISSLHSRDITRLYAKAVKKGQPVGHELSNEEKQAIKNAQKTK